MIKILASRDWPRPDRCILLSITLMLREKTASHEKIYQKGRKLLLEEMLVFCCSKGT